MRKERRKKVSPSRALTHTRTSKTAASDVNDPPLLPPSTVSSELRRGRVPTLASNSSQVIRPPTPIVYPPTQLAATLCHEAPLTWGCRGHVRLSCGWPPADRSSGASSRRRRRIYHRLTWRWCRRCCCSPMVPSISSFCRQEGEAWGSGKAKTKTAFTIDLEISQCLEIKKYRYKIIDFFGKAL